MPWVHLHVDTSGKVNACCSTNITFGNVNEKPIKEIWNDESIRKFRKATLDGKRDKRCAACFRNEDAGKSSMRTETLSKFGHHLDRVEQTSADGRVEDYNPIYFDIRFNNLCNLRCRTCWHGASSSWFGEAKQLKNNFGEKAIISAVKDPTSLLDQILSQTLEIEEIYFAGGEPLMMQEHYELLERLIAVGNTKVHLRYNTNLSVLSLKKKGVLGFWSEFDHVTVSASIDGLGKPGEYIRKGLDWSAFEDNMKHIKHRTPQVKLEIAPTVSVFNLHNIAGMHQYFVDQKLIDIDAIYLNVLSRPDYYNIKVLPHEWKQRTEKSIRRHLIWLDEHGANSLVISEFESLITYMNLEDWSDRIPALKKNIQTLDEMRDEKFADDFPELTDALYPV